jgi:uncharacterized protein YndB with AHSA1/START domain
VSDTRLEIERLIPAPPERVFALWTEPQLVVKWFGPEGYTVPDYRADLRPGGGWRSIMLAPDGKRRIVSGVYRAIERPRRLVFTWAWEDERAARGHETEVTVTFDAAPGGTRLRLSQETFETRQDRDGHNRGWSQTLDKLGHSV